MDENIKQLGINLVGVIKAMVRDVASERKTADETITSMSRSGGKWFPHEENQLWEEFIKFTELAAITHKRSAGAIRSRLFTVAQSRPEF